MAWWELIEQGWDAGAASIYHRMRRAGQQPPSIRTVHRVLVRAGLVTPEPGKRPRSSYLRFSYPRTNDCWQIDATECALAGGSTAVVFHLIDDCSRKSLHSVAAAAETAEAARRCVSEAIAAHGVPGMFLSDNGSAFSGKCRGGEAELERCLRALGVRVVTSSPYHPQTCGKDERLHLTFKRWLTRQPVPRTIAELQTLADTFDHGYNSERPHSAHHGATPDEVGPAANAAPNPPPRRTRPPASRRSPSPPAAPYASGNADKCKSANNGPALPSPRSSPATTCGSSTVSSSSATSPSTPRASTNPSEGATAAAADYPG